MFRSLAAGCSSRSTSFAWRRSSPTCSPSRPRILGKRVLVVDDNSDAAETLADILRELGHTTSVAHDGPTALAAAAAFKPHVALLDIGLPVMDGYELARRLKEQPDLHQT